MGVFQNNVIRLKQTDSTNEQAKALLKAGSPHGTVVVADSQTAGKGQKGRTFFSPPDSGLYVSVIVRELTADEASVLTATTAVAVCRAVESVAPTAVQIKWVNDLVVNGKKIAGILTEGQSNGDTVHAIVGIGINVHRVEFPDELRTIAGSVEEVANAPVDREALLNAMLCELESGIARLRDRGWMEEYRARSSILGKTVTVTAGDRVFDAVAVDIDRDGALTVECNGKRERYIFGEVRVK